MPYYACKLPYLWFDCQVQYTFCNYNCMDFSIQESWQEFGIDFEGPVPLDEDENAVVVEELPHFLSQEEMTTLRQHISQPASMNDEWMIQLCSNSIYHTLTIRFSIVL